MKIVATFKSMLTVAMLLCLQQTSAAPLGESISTPTTTNSTNYSTTYSTNYSTNNPKNNPKNNLTIQTPNLATAPAPPSSINLDEEPSQSFRVLCYHDIRDDLRSTMADSPESTAIDTRELTRQFSWLEKSGYHPVSLQHIIDARAGRAVLPSHAVLLSFDDGYESTYTKVFPLLKQFQYPALIALVGDWMDATSQPNTHVAPGTRFVNWDQVREMKNSGLVEIASHSYELHQGILANPQGNLLPAATTHQYLSADKTYESDTAYEERLNADLVRNADIIERHTGQRPRAMVWPYGAYNRLVADWAVTAGMPVSMTLDGGPNFEHTPLTGVRRELVSFTTNIASLHDMLHAPAASTDWQNESERAMQIDLDYVYDPDPTVQEANLSKLLERVLEMRPRTVYLQAFADPDGDGIAASVYFPNRHLPMRADLFSRVAWQLRTRARVKVYAWMPVIGFRLPATDPAAKKLVTLDPAAPASARKDRSPRLSPFDAEVRNTIKEIYEDLGKHATFAGVLFHDDATLSDYEDSSPAALTVYQNTWHLPATVAAIRADPILRKRWSKQKTNYLNAFTLELAKTLQRYQPGLLTARNLFAEPVLNVDAEEWYAQSLTSFISTYDHVALMAMPQMEKATDPVRWMERLAQQVAREPGALSKTIFELQSRDWRAGKPISASTMASQMKQLRLRGVRHLAYYPDDFHHNQPDARILRPAFSSATDPVPK